VHDSSAPQLTQSAAFSLVITRLDPLAIVTASPLPVGTVGHNYEVGLLATGGITPYHWMLGSGSLPPRIVLNDTEQKLQGTPQQAGPFFFTLVARDSSAQPMTQSKTFNMTVFSAPSWCIQNLPGGSVGQAYQQTLCAVGGVGAYTWQLVSGALPPGLALNGSA